MLTLQLTHIQFLTLLYPSRIEARLIFFILGKNRSSALLTTGPLAVASSALFFCDISDNQTLIDLGDAIRNVFSSCLLLIFTLSLCIWGFLVNRNRAWRLDGGTGVFGMGALGLAFVTTASSFVAVKEEHIDWLQHLIWAAVLWQTWLGWWWWVGAGMGIGEVEDIMERAIRKRRKAARRAHRRSVIAANDTKRDAHPTMAGRVKMGANNAVNGFTTGLANMFPNGSHHSASGSGDHQGGSGHFMRRGPRRRTARVVPPRDEEEGLHEEIELGSLRLVEPTTAERHLGTEDGSGGGRQPPSSNSETSSTSRTPSLHAPRTAGEFFAFPATWLQIYFRRLRHAHEEAARKSALEQAERRKRVPTIAGSGVPDEGWGLGQYGVHEHAQSSRRLAEAGRRLRSEQLLGDDDDVHDSDADEDVVDTLDRDAGEGSGTSGLADEPSTTLGTDSPGHNGGPSRRQSNTHSRRSSRARSNREWDADGGTSSRRPSRRTSRPDGCAREIDRQPSLAEDGGGGGGRGRRARRAEDESDWVDVFSSSDEPGPSRHARSLQSHRSRPRRSQSESRSRERSQERSRSRSRPRTGTATPRQPPDEQRPPPRTGAGWSWWGPLREWRLQDKSTF